MPKSIAIQQFERRLAELGCPPRKLRRFVEEFAQHHKDLKREGIEEGLAEAAAEARATQLLGEPVELAERLAAVLRQSSWFGRHRILSFCVLPPLGIFGGSVLGLVLVICLLRLCYSADAWRDLADRGDGFNPLAIGVRGSWYLAIALTTLLFCRLARGSGAGIRWMLAACATCSLSSFFGFCRVIPHSTTIGYSTAPNWHCALIPLFIALILYSRHRCEQLKVRNALGRCVPLALAFGALLLGGCAADKNNRERVYERGWIGGQYKLAHRPSHYNQGDTVNALPADVCKEFKAGALVMRLGTNVPAHFAGVREGDLVVRVNDKPVTSLRSFRDEIEQTQPGQTVDVQVWRDGELENHTIEVGTEKYRLQRTIALGLILHDFNFGWDPGVSLAVLGFHPDSGHRVELAAVDQEFARKSATKPQAPSEQQWAAWLAIVEVSKSKTIISQEPNERKNAL